METIDYSFIGFLVTCVIALAAYCKYLVGKIIKITETNTVAFKELQHAVSNNTDVTKDLKQAIQNINNK